MTQFIIFLLLGIFFAWIMKGYKRYEQGAYRRESFQNFSLTREHLAQSELGLFVTLCAKVAKADGRVHELEAELLGNMFTDISRLFPDPEQARTLLKEIFATEKSSTQNSETVALKLYRVIGRDIQKQHQMLAFLLNLAFADGHLSHAEEQIVRKIAALWHFDAQRFETMLQQFAGMHANATTQSSLDEAYALLNVTADDDLDTIKKAYRKEVRKYHPDIIKAQGASEEYVQDATEKVQQINAAYEAIKRSRA